MFVRNFRAEPAGFALELGGVGVAAAVALGVEAGPGALAAGAPPAVVDVFASGRRTVPALRAVTAVASAGAVELAALALALALALPPSVEAELGGVGAISAVPALVTICVAGVELGVGFVTGVIPVGVGFSAPLPRPKAKIATTATAPAPTIPAIMRV